VSEVNHPAPVTSGVNRELVVSGFGRTGSS
jgi:hypothetical protein